MFTKFFICELLLQHVSASVLSCLQGVRNFFIVCILCVKLFGSSFTCMIKIIINI